MAGRPEGGGEYNSLPEDYASYGNQDGDVAAEFEPYRPGDESAEPTFFDDVKDALGSFFEKSERPEPTASGSHRIQAGDKVRNVRGVGGLFGNEVPPGTKGEVVGIENGLFSERVTVKFDNGYQETLDASGLKYESGWY